MQTSLTPHPAFGGFGLDAIEVSLDQASSGEIHLRYNVVGDISRIVVPPPGEPLRTDGLWESTCFELFLRRDGEEGYLEFNFAPSGAWAAYAFNGYREGMVQAAMSSAPRIRTSVTADRLEVEVTFSPRLREGAYPMNVAAILKDRSGNRSFWATSHPEGEPDFHDPACFTFELPAAQRP